MRCAAALCLLAVGLSQPASATSDFSCSGDNGKLNAWFEFGGEGEIIAVFAVTVHGKDWSKYPNPSNSPHRLPLTLSRSAEADRVSVVDFYDSKSGKLVMKLRMYTDKANEAVGGMGILYIPGDGNWPVKCDGE